MGDRTYVSLYIPTELVEQAMPIIEAGAGSPCDEEGDDQHITFLGFDECNYGILGCEEEMIEAGIPFTKRWDAGGSYTAGKGYVRFTNEGELVRFEVYAEDRGVPLDRLEEALKQDGDADPILRSLDALARVERLVASHRAATVPLPWDNQVEYGRRYVAAQGAQQ